MTKAFSEAVRYLARRDHSEYELHYKLKKKGHPDNEINEAIAECKRLHLQR